MIRGNIKQLQAVIKLFRINSPFFDFQMQKFDIIGLYYLLFPYFISSRKQMNSIKIPIQNGLMYTLKNT